MALGKINLITALYVRVLFEGCPSVSIQAANQSEASKGAYSYKSSYYRAVAQRS
jgi:hypothetical protein